MLVNPQVGQRVYRAPLDRYGTIVSVSPSVEVVGIQFDGAIQHHAYFFSSLDPVIESLEEQNQRTARIADQQRRQAHADKYL